MTRPDRLPASGHNAVAGCAGRLAVLGVSYSWD